MSILPVDGKIYLIQDQKGNKVIGKARVVKSEQYFDYPYFYGPVTKSVMEKEWSLIYGYEADILEELK